MLNEGSWNVYILFGTMNVVEGLAQTSK